MDKIITSIGRKAENAFFRQLLDIYLQRLKKCFQEGGDWFEVRYKWRSQGKGEISPYVTLDAYFLFEPSDAAIYIVKMLVNNFVDLGEPVSSLKGSF